jgi:ABC-type phosphate transport system substrate-binding protein
MLAFFGNSLFVGAARADYGPGTYDATGGTGDVVCVGSDTLQYIGDFLADGSPAHAGYNNNQSKHDKLVSIDATGDAEARFSYAQTQTVSVLTPVGLDPSVVIRNRQLPTQRPNGSGAGYRALLADVTTTAGEKINCVRGSSYPSSQNFTDAQNVATGHPWGGLHVVRGATETLGVAAANTTNAPAGISDAELVPIYQGVSQTWGDLPGYTGPCPACTIVPMVPQPGSGTRNTFLADLQAFNGNVPVVLGANVRQGIEENDPTAITNLPATDVPNAIVPFSGGRLNLWNSGYFHNPHVAFNNNPFPGGETLTPGISLLTGTAPDAAPGYTDVRGLFFTWRAIDDNAPIWRFDSTTKNWVHELFLDTSPTNHAYINGFGKSLVTDSGATPAWVDCGVNATPVPAQCANHTT